MLLTCGLNSRGAWSLRAGLWAGAWGLLVTSCGPSVERLAAAGGQSGVGRAGAGTGGTGHGQLRAVAPSGGQLPVTGATETDLPAAGRGAEGGASGAGESGGIGAVAGSVDSEPKRYPGRGFVVHEWGTDTFVVGSDGSLQRGLHHEEEDLPSFVYDRIKAGTLLGSTPSPSVTIKMETPVTYFYSPTSLTVSARVEFPKGVLTQWYPNVTSFQPSLAAAGSVGSNMPAALSDPALDPSFPFLSESCRVKHGSVSGGRLDWGSFSVQARDAAPKEPAPDAPLEQFAWSYARVVDANWLQMASGESERFLFYRGLGEFDLPVKVQAKNAAQVTLSNGYAEPVGHVFLLNVSHEHGAFVARPEGIAPGVSLDETVPSLEGAASLDEYAQRLSDAVTSALDATGLYHDEAVAMVNTWRRQWFRTPGVRALYVLPQSWTEQSIPLTITPKPDATVRVMLIRVEVITQEQESADVSALSTFATDAALGAAYFSALGRFAEPRLRRALQLSSSAAGEKYLAQIAGAQSSISSGE
ncbi:MAG TPA: hypothetical protein VER11_17805 [Polyangiaceae bacterium]|nr:hypothetical protein [Polyangiaceae bacterium]